MRWWAVVSLIVAFCGTIEAGKCRSKYFELVGKNDGFIPRRCRSLNTVISEDYWTTVGYDGQLRDGRSTDDFLVFPVDQNNGHRQRNSYVGYWITRSKYGSTSHYEAFGHVFVKPDGRVCGWFVGFEKEIVEVCGGFRVLSRNRRNPSEPIPFEWAQDDSLRERDTLGFHHHRIAKYEWAPDEVFFGDAHLTDRKFQGVSPNAEKFVEVTSPNEFSKKIWLLKRKNNNVAPVQPPQNIYVDQRQDSRYRDPSYRQDPRYIYQQPQPVRRPQQDPRTLMYLDPHGRIQITDPRWLASQGIAISQDTRPNAGRTIGNDLRPGQPGYDEYYRRRLEQAASPYQTPGSEQQQRFSEGQTGFGGPGVDTDGQQATFDARQGRPAPSRAYQIGEGAQPGQPGYQVGTGTEGQPGGYHQIGGQPGQAGYQVGEGAQPGQPGSQYQIGSGGQGQPGYQVGGGVQPGQPGYQVGNKAEGQLGQSGYQLGEGAQPGQPGYQIGGGVQPGQSGYQYQVGSGAQGQPGYQIGIGGQPAVNYQIIGGARGAKPGEPGYRRPTFEVLPNGQIVDVGSEAVNGQSNYVPQSSVNYQIGGGARTGSGAEIVVPWNSQQTGSGGQGYQIGGGAQPGQSGYKIGEGVQGQSEGSGTAGNRVDPRISGQPGEGLFENIGSSISSGGQTVDQRIWPADSDERYRNVDVYGRRIDADGRVLPSTQGHYKLAKIRPKTIVRDQNGNVYHRKIENGKVYYYAISESGQEKKIPGNEIDGAIERRRQEEHLGRLIAEQDPQGAEDTPIVSAAEAARNAVKEDAAQDRFFF